MPGVGRFGVAVRLIMLAFLTFAALATTACAVDQGPQEQDGQQQEEAPQQDEAQQQNGAGQENGDQQQEDTSSNGGDAQTGEATGEIYEVGPAGEVEYQRITEASNQESQQLTMDFRIDLSETG